MRPICRRKLLKSLAIRAPYFSTVLITNSGFVLMEKKDSQPERQSTRARNSRIGIGRDEMNLCELPFATLSERAGSRNSLHFEIEDFDRKLNQVVQRTLCVSGDPEYGLPTAKDEEIYLGLLKYTSDLNGCTCQEVQFSRARLFELMGWPKSDWAYARLTKGLHRLVGVRLRYQNLWRDNHNKQWRDQGAFGILESFQLRDVSNSGTQQFVEYRSVFRWSSVLFESFDSGYLKRIDYELARRLNTTARRLYRYLDKHFHPPQRMELKLDLARLGYQHLGVSPGTDLDKVRKRYIGPAAEALESAGYLEVMSSVERFQPIARGKWTCTFLRAHKRVIDESGLDRRNEKLVAGLRRRGCNEETANRLVQKFSREQVRNAARAFDEQRRKGIEVRSVERWFTAALKRGFQPSDEPTRKSALRPERRIFRAGTIR